MKFLKKGFKKTPMVQRVGGDSNGDRSIKILSEIKLNAPRAKSGVGL